MLYLSKLFKDYINFTLLVSAVFLSSVSFSLAAALVLSPEPSSPIVVETLSTQEFTDETNKTEEVISDGSPLPPEVESQTFTDPDIWYSKTEGVFTWILPPDISAVAFEISNNQENIPEENKDAVIDPPVGEFEIGEGVVSDGVQYVSVNFKNQIGWGGVTNRKLQIDTTAPEPFAINIRPSTSKNSFPFLNFNADDQTSGIDYYDISVADNESIRITPNEARFGYQLNELEDGSYAVKVVATDMAGNARESSTVVHVTAGWIKPIEKVDEGQFWNILSPVNLFIFFLLVLIVLQIIYYWQEHKQIKKREEKLRYETREIQDQMEKIFSALRDEVCDQINSIAKRKKLSNKEKEVVGGLIQALEVSETLLEKEINDVKIILK